jgi:hypothetical protein
MQKLRNILFLSVFFFGFALFAHAQSLSNFTQVQFGVAPQTPGPNTEVTIAAQGVGGFLQDAQFTWQKDGATALSGVGESTYTFVTKEVGVPTRIHVEIISAAGNFTKDFTFTPANINLLWESDTSVPPLYRGKALYTPGSKIKVVALPQVFVDGAAIAQQALSYQWSVNGNPVSSASGVGRSVFEYYGNQLNKSESVSVTIKYGGASVGSASTVISAAKPFIAFYVKDPLRGVLFDQTLPSVVSLIGQELTLFAQPYYFSNESFGKTLSYAWTLNGEEVTGPDTEKGVLTLRQSGAGEGQSSIGLKLENSDDYKFIQNAAAQLMIVFGLQSSQNGASFGL